MTRLELEEYIFDTYGVRPDYPWDSTPSSEVFRHGDNKKWFALIMDVPKSSLGIPGGGTLCAVNLKCGPIVGGSLCGQNGFFPAYHMNKEYWITAALDGSVPESDIKMLLDISFCETAKRKAIKKPSRNERRPDRFL